MIDNKKKDLIDYIDYLNRDFGLDNTTYCKFDIKFVGNTAMVVLRSNKIYGNHTRNLDVKFKDFDSCLHDMEKMNNETCLSTLVDAMLYFIRELHIGRR